MSNIVPAEAIEKALIGNDLASLTPTQRLGLYKTVCESVGLNPMTQPLSYIVLNGKLTLYAKKDATDQLRKIHGVSIRITSRARVDDLYVVTAEATDRSGRVDEAMGAVNVTGLKGEALANAMLKSETKSKRRVTLSITGLGILDETEIEDVSRENKSQPFNNDPFGKKQAALDQQKQETPVPEASPAASAAETEAEDLGQYVVQVGRKFKGKKLADIDQFELDGYLKWLRESGDLSGLAAEFVKIADEYLSSKEVRS